MGLGLGLGLVLRARRARCQQCEEAAQLVARQAGGAHASHRCCGLSRSPPAARARLAHCGHLVRVGVRVRVRLGLELGLGLVAHRGHHPRAQLGPLDEREVGAGRRLARRRGRRRVELPEHLEHLRRVGLGDLGLGLEPEPEHEPKP